MIVKVFGVPVQALAVGVTVIVATIGALVLLVAVKLGTLPFPDTTSPIIGLLFVQAKVAPATGLVKLVKVVVAPLQ